MPRCYTCGKEVDSAFDHVDIECETIDEDGLEVENEDVEN